MTETFDPDRLVQQMKWTRNRYGEYRAHDFDQSPSVRYGIVREYIKSEDGYRWLVHRDIPGQPAQLLRPLSKTLKLAKERAERERHGDKLLKARYPVDFPRPAPGN